MAPLHLRALELALPSACKQPRPDLSLAAFSSLLTSLSVPSCLKEALPTLPVLSQWLSAHAPPSLHGSPCAHLFVCLSTLCLRPLQCKPSAGRALSTFSLPLSQLLEECFRHLTGCRTGLHEKTRTWLLSPVTCLRVKIYSFKHLKDNNNNGAKRSGSRPTYILRSWVTPTGDTGFSSIIKEMNFLNLLLYSFLLMGKALHF